MTHGVVNKATPLLPPEKRVSGGPLSAGCPCCSLLLIRWALRGELSWTRCAEAYVHAPFFPTGTDDQWKAGRGAQYPPV